MLYKTRGIVLHQLKYSETSVIAKIYTETFGLESFLLKGFRKKNSKIKPALLQHLSIVDMEIYHNAKSRLHHIREIKIHHNYTSLPFDIKKSSIALFINEILYKSIKEETPNQKLFNFIFNSIIILDDAVENYSDFHFHFLIELSKYLGFFPNNNYSGNNNIFNLKEGTFQSHISDSSICISQLLSNHIYMLLIKSFGEYYVPSGVRKELLNVIIEYYKTHVSGLTTIKSNQVMETVLN